MKTLALKRLINYYKNTGKVCGVFDLVLFTVRVLLQRSKVSFHEIFCSVLLYFTSTIPAILSPK